MFQRLVSHNEDIARLVDRGYAVAVDVSNHLVVRDVPYLDAAGELRWGALVAKLVFTDTDHVAQDDHQVYFAGSPPHQLDGQPIANLAGGPSTIALSEACGDVTVERSFSNKPFVNGQPTGFLDFFEKIESYVAIVSGPAMDRHGVSPYTFRSVVDDLEDPIFKFNDTLTSRAEIGELTARFADERVAVIGLGGTGSYLVDFLVKSRVKSIVGFDGDKFHVHNAYRAPGRTSAEEFNRPKAEVLQGRYDNFRHELDLRATYIDRDNVSELAGVTFAFVCVDNGSARAAIFDLLMGLGIPYIDVGMGLKKRPDDLTGSMRVTRFMPKSAAALRARAFAAEVDEPENVYRANIQIAELNALNASLAIIRYKQLRGFYRSADDLPADHLIFNLTELMTFTEGAE